MNLIKNFLILISWLSRTDVYEVGASHHGIYVHADFLQGYDCNANYSRSSIGFYRETLFGGFIGNNRFPNSYINLFWQDGNVYFVRGLQEMGSFGDYVFPGLPSRTDHIIILIEYTDIWGNYRVENEEGRKLCN